MSSPTARIIVAAALVVSAATPAILDAQDRLKEMPGYQRYEAMAGKIRPSVKTGAINPRWADDSRSFEFSRDGKSWRYDVRGLRVVELDSSEATTGAGFAGRGRGPARGRQATEAISPDSSLKALYRERNLWMANADGTAERPITRDGSEERRIKYGTASWVYGEELRQRSAMWWSPDSKRIAYYRFDESPVTDYFLQMDQTKVQGSVMIEAYPKAGTDNPIVDLFVYDVESGESIKLDVRSGEAFAEDVVGYYVYGVTWSPSGEELLINRTNRRQNTMELAACSPATGDCRTVVHEEWLPSWVTNSPRIEWLEDGERFIWESERNGFKNLYLYNISGELIAPLTEHDFEVSGLVRVDEDAEVVWYTARSGDNYMKTQLHRVGLDGRNDRRLTDPSMNHTTSVSPDGKHIVDVAQTHDVAPTTQLLNDDGRVLATIAESDLSEFNELGLNKVELFTYLSADGETELHGMLHKPSNFDPAKQYPVLFSVYGGPATNGARETFTTPHQYTEYGFLYVTLDTRSAAGKGKRSLDAIYLKLGEVEVDDMAAASRELAKRSYVDGERVGIYGTSYGGYTSALAVLRHPDAFSAASASSPVTSWYHYDTIYTERYMWTPQGNAEGYDMGNAMKYAEDLDGRLMLYYGTADDNVHPSNMMQFIQALQQAGKSFDVQVGPDRGHSSINQPRMMEFFIENLVMKALRLTS